MRIVVGVNVVDALGKYNDRHTDGVPHEERAISAHMRVSGHLVFVTLLTLLKPENDSDKSSHFCVSDCVSMRACENILNGGRLWHRAADVCFHVPYTHLQVRLMPELDDLRKNLQRKGRSMREVCHDKKSSYKITIRTNLL